MSSKQASVSGSQFGSESKVESPAKFLIYSALVAIQVLFAAGYVITKIVLQHFPPLVWASIRIIIATICMFTFAYLFRRKHAPKITKDFLLKLIVFSLLGIIINQSCFLVGLKYTTPTNSAILNTLIPVFTFLFVTMRGFEPLNGIRVLGFILSFTGVLILRKIEDFSFSDSTMIGDLLMIVNCISYGLFLTFSKKFLEKIDRVWATSWMFLYGSVGLTILALPDFRNFEVPPMDSTLVFAMAYAIIGTTLLTYFLNNWTLAYTKSSNVALFAYLQPVVTASIAFMAYGESVTFRTTASSGLIFIGFVLVLYSDKIRARFAAKT